MPGIKRIKSIKTPGIDLYNVTARTVGTVKAS
jgi:hypothetical protein